MNLDERNNYPDRTEFDLSVMGFLPLQEIGHLNLPVFWLTPERSSIRDVANTCTFSKYCLMS